MKRSTAKFVSIVFALGYVQEKLYVELKTILGRQPGPAVAEQLSVYQENLKHKVTW